MDSDSTARINQAVDAALERCAKSPLIHHSALRDYLQEVEADGSLSPDERAAVEAAVIRVLASQSH